MLILYNFLYLSSSPNNFIIHEFGLEDKENGEST